MEEDEEGGWGSDETDERDGPEGRGKRPLSHTQEYVLENLVKERRYILTELKASNRTRLKLLRENRNAITLATGGRVSKTENIAYGILVFGGVLIVTLALLTAFANLPSQITLSFVGTVLGGTIATIAQKLGKL